MKVMIPPHDIEAEQAVLGAMMIDNESIGIVAGALAAEDFYTEAHRNIFSTALELYLGERPVEPIALKASLETKGKLAKSGDAAYLHTLMEQAVSSANVSHYVQIVKDNSYLRSFIKITTQGATLAYDKPEDPKGLNARVQTLLYQLDERDKTAKPMTFLELLKLGFEEIEAAKDGRVGGIRTGFAGIDRLLTGLYPGDLIILAARPAMGKTALALNMLFNIADQTIPVAMFSLEMSKEQLVQRVYCSTALIDSFKLRSGNLADDDWNKLSRATGTLAALPVLIDDTASPTLIDIKSRAREYFRGFNRSGVIIVDYLQLIQAIQKRSNRQEEVAEISRGLKVIAKELSVPVIALSQLSRANELRPDKMPQLSDLRDSGALEQDADIVGFIHRNVASEKEEDRAQTKFKIAKHRKGPTGIVDLRYDEHFTKFYSVEKRYGAG